MTRPLIIAIIAALLCGCVKGDVHIYWNGRRAESVSNITQRVHEVRSDYKNAKEQTPTWLLRGLEFVAEKVGLPKAAGGLVATVLTGTLIKIRSNRKKRAK